ncbi:MAG: HIRAN domain-containing protein [Clostridia bacterium]|nr:HIRAN domain-containing protein [Clostridia bacterium]
MNVYVTITGYKHYFGSLPFSVSATLRLVRETDNQYDAAAIAVYHSAYGKVGYVAQRKEMIAHGTSSARSIAPFLSSNAKAIVRFIAGEFIIAELIPTTEE